MGNALESQHMTTVHIHYIPKGSTLEGGAGLATLSRQMVGSTPSSSANAVRKVKGYGVGAPLELSWHLTALQLGGATCTPQHQ